MNITNENSIRLIIRKVFADEIKAGTKVREYRDESPFYLNRLYLKSDVEKEGYEQVTENSGKKIWVKIKKIEYIVFQEGYTKNQFICECKGYGYIQEGAIKKLTENDILYPEYQKENSKNLYTLIKDEYVASGDDSWFIVFSLGRILE